MIPQETVQQILDIARIDEVVGDFVTLKRRGASFVACCPFHNEKTPSFYVTPSKGIFKCFGCGKSGSAVGFVMEHEHCSYAEALRYLARRYHIEIKEKEETAEDIALRQRKESLLLASEFARNFFASQLSSGEGRAVGYQYFRTRGLEDATIEKFGLGWAPSGKTALLDAATAAGYKIEYLLDAGLVVRREDGSLADKFRERVMFPVYSVSGRVVAFSGRTLRSDNPAKYLNSADTDIYHKKDNLLGIYHAKAEISRLHKCILVEGNVDMTTMHQLGICNVVASCGTSLTVEQIRLISRFTAPENNITIMYDGDSAGIHAAVRGLGLVLAEGLNVKVVLLPDGDDPDSFCRKHTLAEVTEYIKDNEKDFIRFYTSLILSDAGDDPLRKANLINDIADMIALIPDPVKRSVYVDDVAVRFGIEPEIIHSRVGRTRRKTHTPVNIVAPEAVPAPEAAPEPLPAGAAPVQSEKDLLYFLMTHGRDCLDFPTDSEYYGGSEDSKPTVADFIRDALDGDSSNLFRRVFDSYMSMYDSGMTQEAIVKSILDSPDREMAELAASVATEKYRLTVGSFEASLTTTASWLVTYVPKAIMVYALDRIRERLRSIRRGLSAADEQTQDAYMREMIKLQNAEKRIRKKIGR